MFIDQLEKACKTRKTTITAATLNIGMSKGTISNWKKGATPTGDVVVRFAELLGVSTDYLLTGKETEPVCDNLSTEAAELARRWDALDADGKALVRAELVRAEDRSQK